MDGADGDVTALQVQVDAGNYNYCSADGVLFNRYKTTLLQYPQGKQGGYSIPSTVAVIAEHAFEGCTGLTCITIPSPSSAAMRSSAASA